MNRHKPDPAQNSSTPVVSTGDFQTVVQHLATARAVLRTVALAVKAQIDGSIQFDDNGVERWQLAVDLAVTQLAFARDELLNKAGLPAVDWFTPLSLLEAMGAALWANYALATPEPLDDLELDIVVQVAIELLDSLMLRFEREGANHV